MVASLLCTLVAGPQDRQIEFLRIPNGGIQPQAAVDDNGIIHLVYFEGKEGLGDLFFVARNGENSTWSRPLRVNSAEKSVPLNPAFAMAQIALGENGRVHVTWFDMEAGSFWYTRLNDEGSGFEAQRVLVSEFGDGVESGAALAADGKGNVYAVWHAGDLSSEARRAVYLTHSKDGGKTFGPERRINPTDTGACGCCALGAAVDRGGNLYVSYRAAGKNVQRDMILLESTDGGRNFLSKTIDPWRLEGCPVTITSLAATAEKGIVVSWAKEGRIYFADDKRLSPIPAAAPVSSGRQQYSAIAAAEDGRTLLVWAVGQGWSSGGALHWQIFDAGGKPAAEKGNLNTKLPNRSVVEAVALPEGRFVIIH